MSANGLDRRRFLVAAGAAGLGSLVSGGTAAATGGAKSTVYIGSFTSTGGPGLDVGQVDRRTGVLTLTGTVDGVPDPSFFAFSINRRTLYSTNELARGSVTALDIGPDPQRPVVLNSRSTLGAGPTHLSVHPSNRYLLTANYTDGTVVVHGLESDGRIGESTDLVRHQGTDRDPHAHQVLTDPSGRWVLAVDLGADSVFVYRLNLNTGKLTVRQQLRLPTGAGPRHLAFHPHGRYVYIVGELRSEITVVAWDPAGGHLTPGQVVATVGPDAPTPNFPAEVAVTRDGRFVYASNRGENSIATFTVHDRGARISLVDTTSCGGNWPRHFTLSQDEHWVYVANQRSNSVTRLPRDPVTGRLGEVVQTTSVNSVGIVLIK